MKVYVSTYKKYNEGRLTGAWIEFDDEDELLEKANALHADEPESERELMYQDFEDFPRQCYGESGLKSILWDWARLSDYDKDIVATYWQENSSNDDVRYILDHFVGIYDSEEEYAQEQIEIQGVFDKHPNLACYFDYKAYAANELSNNDMLLTNSENRKLYVFSH